MIQIETMVDVADNSGAKKGKVISLYGGFRRRYAHIGDQVLLAIRSAQPHSGVKKGEMHRGVVVRTRRTVRRPDGTCVRFDDNAVVLVDPKTKEPKGTRIFGPVARELRGAGYMKIVSLAPEVL